MLKSTFEGSRSSVFPAASHPESHTNPFDRLVSKHQSGSSSTESLLNGDEEHLSFSGSASSSDGGYNYSVDSADLPPEYSLGYEYNDSE